jgi:hypothetical protein
MTPAAFPLNLYRGDTYRWSFAFWTDAARDTPADLSGVTVAAEIRDRPGGSAVTALTCSVVANAVLVELTAEACKGLPPAGAWDLQLTYVNGDVATVLAGPVIVAADVTDSTAAAPATTPLTLVPRLRRAS